MSTPPAVIVGANIRAEMARRDITQTTLAAQLGLKQGQVSKRLRGHIAFDVNELHAVAAFLGVPVATLLAIDVPVAS